MSAVSRSHWRACCRTCRCERGIGVEHREGASCRLGLAFRRPRRPVPQGRPRRMAYICSRKVKNSTLRNRPSLVTSQSPPEGRLGSNAVFWRCLGQVRFASRNLDIFSFARSRDRWRQTELPTWQAPERFCAKVRAAYWRLRLAGRTFRSVAAWMRKIGDQSDANRVPAAGAKTMGIEAVACLIVTAALSYVT